MSVVSEVAAVTPVYTRFAVGQDHQALGRNAFWQHFTAQRGSGQRQRPRVQRGEDGFAVRGHVVFDICWSNFRGWKSLRFDELPKFKLISAKGAADRVSAAIRVGAPHADRVLEWGRKQQAWASSHLPDSDQIETWARENADRFGWREKPASSSLEHLEDTLTQIVAAIRQTSDKKAKIAVAASIKTLSGALAVGSISSLVGTFGTASTGAALVTLHGAAATSALNFWIGSVFGLGAVAGANILTAGGLGVGVAAGLFGARRMFGKTRCEDALQEHEKAILVACIALINASQQQREEAQSPSSREVRRIAEQALIPLANQINQHWDDASLKENGKSECEPFTRTLAYLQRRKLDQCRTELGRIALTAMAKDTTV